MNYDNIYLKKINIMISNTDKNNKENVMKVVSYIQFLFLGGFISKDELCFLFNSIVSKNDIRILFKKMDEYIDNILTFRYDLNDIYLKIIQLYEKYQTGYLSYDGQKELYNEAFEFMKYINCYQLYKQINDNSMINYHSKAIDYSCCVNNGEKLSYIVLANHKQNSYKKVMSLVHEMGHAVVNNNSCGNKSNLFDVGIESEVFSLCFERIFMDFLLERGKVEYNLVRRMQQNFETEFYKITLWAKYVNDIFDDKYTSYSINNGSLEVSFSNENGSFCRDLRDNNYAIGNATSAILLCQYKKDKKYFISHISEIVNEIKTMSFEKIISEYSNISSLRKCLDNNLVKKLNNTFANIYMYKQ